MIKSMIVTKPDEAHSMSQTLGEIWLLKHPAALSEPYRGLSFLNISNCYTLGHLIWKKSFISNFISGTDC